MELGAELLTRSDLTVESGRFIEMWFRSDNQILEESAGRDEFKRKAFFSTGCRVAATGRLSIWDLPPRFKLAGVRPCWPVNVPVNPGERKSARLSVEIRTNIPVTYIEFIVRFAIRLVEKHGKTVRSYDLDDPSVAGFWPQRGRFCFNLPGIT